MRWGTSLAVVVGGLLMLLSPASARGIWPTTHRQISEKLLVGDVSERRAAAAKLLALPPKQARRLARKALRDSDDEVRLLAARAAITLGLVAAGDEVKDWLSARDPRLRIAACELIEASPTRTSVESLARVLSDAQPQVRKAAAVALGASGEREMAAALLGHLDDTAPAVRVAVVRALGRLGDGRAVVPLVSKLQDRTSEVRREAAKALGQLGDRRATATLVIALQDASLGVRVDGLGALGALRATDAVTAISALFADADPSARMGAPLARGPLHDAALRALADIGSPQAMKLLMRALEREGPVRYRTGPCPVRDAIVSVPKASAAAVLQAVVAAPSSRLASAAALCVGSMQQAGTSAALIRAMQRGNVSLPAGLAALAELEDKAALPFVLEQLDTADVSARRQVIGVALRLLDPADRDGRVVDVVAARVADLGVPLGERIALVKLLGRSGAPRAQKLLLSLRDAKPLPLRVAVVDALGLVEVPDPAVDKVLLKALQDPHQPLREAASRALSQVGGEAAAGHMIQRLGEAAEQDRAALGMALSGALARSGDDSLVAGVDKALASTRASERDALIEGLGRMAVPAAGALLVRLAKQPEIDDRRKVAEALAGHPDQQKTLIAMLADADAGVRANAAWALGKQRAGAAQSALSKAAKDIDVAVAGNAASALGSVATTPKQVTAAVQVLCPSLDDFRSYVRAAALTGLRQLKRGCDKDIMLRVAERDRSWRVRLAAADLFHVLVAKRAEPLRKRYQLALRHCVQSERHAAVAARCEQPLVASNAAEDVVVFVVPESQTVSQPRAPFALVLADGRMRLGVADRRGVVFEAAAPAGPLELAVPAALAR